MAIRALVFRMIVTASHLMTFCVQKLIFSYPSLHLSEVKQGEAKDNLDSSVCT